MLESWRWFGPDDPVSLRQVLQAGARGIVSSLHHIPTGEIWPLQAILERKREIEGSGLSWTVVESLPVHDSIKCGASDSTEKLANYMQSLRNLGEAGVKVVCYNFMPVVDWTRTDLAYSLPNGAVALRFDMTDFALYDTFILARPDAASDYSASVLEQARRRFSQITEQQREVLERNIIAGLPGGEGSHDREGIRAAIEKYRRLGEKGLRQNLKRFLEAVVPVAEECGVNLCIHPDDPAFPLFGLPRIVSTADDVRRIFSVKDSGRNGLTLCAGSFGSNPDNDLVAMFKEFGSRVHFVHLRNIVRESDGSFYESEHLVGDNDMVGLVAAVLAEEKRRSTNPGCGAIAMRPDHGHLIEGEADPGASNPGYSFLGRLKGLAELRGVVAALQEIPRHSGI